MKKGLIGVVLAFFLILVGCSEVASDLESYINDDLIELAELENEAVEAYSAVSGVNYTDDATMHDALTSDVLPKYEEFVTKLESIEPKTTEVQEVHDIFVEGAKEQHEGLQIILTALESQDLAEVERANGLLESGMTKIEQFHEEIKALADEEGIEIEGL